jgi:hypothetical protein
LRSIILALSLVLGLLPLAGVGWILASGMLTLWPPSATVDGLFMTLILLTLSLCFLLNAYWEMRDQGMLQFLQKKKEEKKESLVKAAVPVAAAASTSQATAKVPVTK